jgi:PAS domain S-box-containing protein
MPHTIRVLYVDDEPALLSVGKHFLERKEAFKVDTCRSAAEALESLDTTEYDAIISDYQMPGMDGIEFLRVTRLKDRDIPFILFTGRGREEVVIEAINHGADFYLQKGGEPTAQFAELAHKTRQAVKRREAEDALRTREDLYRTIFTTTGAATIIIEEDTTIVLANEGFARLSGCSVAELEGRRSWTDFVVPEDLERMKQYHHGRRDDPANAPRVYDFRFIDRQNRVKYCIVHVAIIPGTTQSVASVLDITDRVLVEQDYRSILENIQDVFYRTDPEGNLTRLSPSGAAILGYESVTELYGRNIAETLYANPGDREMFLAELDKRGGALTNFEVKLRKKDGTPVYALTSSHKYYDTAGNFGGLEGILRDITGRKLAEEELRKSEKRANLQRTAIAEIVLDQVIAGGETSQALTRVVEMLSNTLGIARASVWTLENDESELLCRALYEADMKTHSSGTALRTIEFPRYFEALKSENSIYANDAQNDPRTREFTESYLRVLGITSMLDAGVFIEGKLVGVVCSEHIGARRTWYPDEESFTSTVAAIVAQIFLNTKRKKAEQALSESEANLQAIMTNTSDIIASYDRDIRLIVYNRACSEVYRDLFGVEIYPGLFTLDLFPESQRGFWNTNNARALAGETFRAEFEMTAPDGSSRFFESSFNPIRRNAEVVGFSTMTRDITERKRTEDDLHTACGHIAASEAELRRRYEQLMQSEQQVRESEERFRYIVETSPDMIWEIDLEGNFRYISPQVEPILGFSPEELTGRSVLLLIPEFAHAFVMQEISRAASGSGLFTVVVPALHKDGQNSTIEIRSLPILDADGHPTGFHGVAHDVTERKKALSALAESEELYRKLVSTVPDIVVRTDLAGNIVFINEPGVMMSGYAKGMDLTGQSVFGFFAPEDLPRAIENTRMMFSHQLGPVEYTFVSREGNRLTLEINGDVLRTPGGEPYGMVYVGRDITGRRKAEEAIRMAHRQLTLLNGITRHDILNMVTVILGFLTLAETRSENPEMSLFIQKIKEKTRQIQYMIEFTRVYEELGSIAPQWLSLHDVLRKNPPPQGIPLSDECADVEIYADVMLGRVFANLVDNSVRHGGNVSEIHVITSESNDLLTILYEDNGTGIPSDEKEMIFERGHGKNTGLGLFLVREILSITGITITETGEPGRGTRFEIVVPRGDWRVTGEK